MNRIEAVVTEATIDQTPLHVVGPTSPVLTPAVVCVGLAAAGITYEVGFNAGGSAEDGVLARIDDEVIGTSSDHLLRARRTAVAD